mgnify:CR=1 FL=1
MSDLSEFIRISQELGDDMAFVQAGGGIVFDSDPESEFLETVNKSQALIAAAREAKNFVSIID